MNLSRTDALALLIAGVALTYRVTQDKWPVALEVERTPEAE